MRNCCLWIIYLPATPFFYDQGLPMSVYSGTMLPPHPPMAEGPGGPMYNGLPTADPAWSPIIKVVPNNADNSDPQQQVCPFHVKSKAGNSALGSYFIRFCSKHSKATALSFLRCGLVPGPLMWAMCTWTMSTRIASTAIKCTQHDSRCKHGLPTEEHDRIRQILKEKRTPR